MRVGIINENNFKLGYRVKDLYLSKSDFKVFYQDSRNDTISEVLSLDIIHFCSKSLKPRSILKSLLPSVLKTLPSLLVLHGVFQRGTFQYLEKKFKAYGYCPYIIFVPYFNYPRLLCKQLEDSICYFYEKENAKKLANSLFEKLNLRTVSFKNIEKGILFHLLLQFKLVLMSSIDRFRDLYLRSNKIELDLDNKRFKSYFNYLGLNLESPVMVVDIDENLKLEDSLLQYLKFKDLRKFKKLLDKTIKKLEKKRSLKFGNLFKIRLKIFCERFKLIFKRSNSSYKKHHN